MQEKLDTLVGQPLLIAGRYRVRACLHSGSTCSVFLCSHIRSPQKLLAVKVLSKSFDEQSVEFKRFRNEVMLSTSVEDSYVVRALDYFEEDAFVGFSMEYAKGGDLADYLAHYRKVPLRRALLIIRQVASGLAAIHKAGLIHRDLKPENVLIYSEHRFKIADFGIACLTQQDRQDDPAEEILGTFDYISPETLQHGETSIRADVYALGVLAYEIITGSCPFQGVGLIETLRNQLISEPMAPSRLCVDCSPKLDWIILRALARDPQNRYADIQSFLYDLDQVSGASLQSKQAEGDEKNSFDGSLFG